MSKNTLEYALHVLIIARNLADNSTTQQVSVLNFDTPGEANRAHEQFSARYKGHPTISVMITQLY